MSTRLNQLTPAEILQNIVNFSSQIQLQIHHPQSGTSEEILVIFLKLKKSIQIFITQSEVSDQQKKEILADYLTLLELTVTQLVLFPPLTHIQSFEDFHGI